MSTDAEWLLFFGLGLAALVGGLKALGRPRSSLWGWALVGFSAAAVAGAALYEKSAADRASAMAAFRNKLPSQNRADGYVRSDRCQACHPGEYETWHRTFHRTMTQYAGPESVIGDFGNVQLELNGQRYRMYRKGDEFWTEMPDPEQLVLRGMGLPSAASPGPVDVRLGLLTGSHHMQIYWIPYGSGNLQSMFPFAWLKEEQRWVPVDSTFLRDPRLPPINQSWNMTCINCHSTGGQPKLDLQTRTLSTRAGELGIACEACHGPAEEHVRRYSSPILRYLTYGGSSADKQIIHPAHLEKPMDSQVCGQCHGILWLPPEEHFKQVGMSYRPGTDLQKSSPVIQPSRPGRDPGLKNTPASDSGFLPARYWSDGEVRVSGREFNGLIDSPCYQRGKLSCFSCHSLHRSDPDDQLAATRGGNEACLQCHEDFRSKQASHSHHARGSSGALCYNCHMPYTTYGLLKGIRSHRISSPNISTNLATGRPNACNLCHMDRTLEWAANTLKTWFNQPMPPLDSDQRHTSALVSWLMRGDAGQRALAAYSAGWADARRASGDAWIAPALAPLLDDPYPSVRYIASRSLRRLPGFAEFPYDYVGEPGARAEARTRAMTIWQSTAAASTNGMTTATLFDSRRQFDSARLGELLRQRDDRSMDLQE